MLYLSKSQFNNLLEFSINISVYLICFGRKILSKAVYLVYIKKLTALCFTPKYICTAASGGMEIYMNFCCKEMLGKLSNACCCLKDTEVVRAINKPYVKKRIDADLEIYSDRSSQKPIFSASMDGSWDYRLLCAIEVIAVAMFIMWLICLLKRTCRKIF